MNEVTQITNTISPVAAEPTTLAAPDLGRDVFLQLLVTQLQSQDPTNPVQNEDFIAQLAQFTTLEQTENTNDLLSKLVDQNVQRSQLDLVGMIGREVIAEGNTVTVETDEDVSMLYSLQDDSQTVQIEIFDAEEKLVNRLQGLGPQIAGEHHVVWNGEDFDGNPVESGTYVYRVLAQDKQGNNLPVTTFARETVHKVVLGTDGPVLALQSGKTLLSSDILVVE